MYRRKGNVYKRRTDTTGTIIDIKYFRVIILIPEKTKEVIEVKKFLLFVIIFFGLSGVAARAEWVESLPDYWVSDAGCSVALGSYGDRWELIFETKSSGMKTILRDRKTGVFLLPNTEEQWGTFISKCGTFDKLDELIKEWDERSPRPLQHKRPERTVPAFYICFKIML